MLLQAMNSFQVAKREYSEAEKSQYSKEGVKDYFRASEVGYADRKIIYGFFKHQIPLVPRTPKSLRTLENGDYVHTRYQKAWEDMGALISMEEKLSSKNDEYLAEFPWTWAGHYDALLDMNILRAHAQGLCTLSYSKNEDTGKWELEVEVDDTYANSIGLFDENADGESLYEPVTMVADIKTMGMWGFKRIVDKGSLEEIQAYIDQISFYMYMLNTPYGSIYIECKDSNEVCEIQIVWTDMHEDVEYTFVPDYHGEQIPGVLRITINNERFFGSDNVEGLVPRVSRLWKIKEELERLDAEGKYTELAEILPPRCSEEPGKFPCSWHDGKEKCEYFDHCWNQYTNGLSIKAYEACPAELQWEIINNSTGEIYTVDSRKVGIILSKENLQALYNMGAIVIEKFLMDAPVAPISEVLEDKAVDGIFNAGGELNLGAPSNPTNEQSSVPQKSNEALEYLNADNKKAIKCLNCGKELTYQKLANGGTKKCEFCNHVNRVTRLS